MRVTLVQSLSAADGSGDNLDAIGSAVKEAKGEVVVFPELYLCGYSTAPELKDRVAQNTERWRNELMRISSESCKWLIVGAALLDSDGLKNVLWVLSPDGGEQRYDKIHLAQFGEFEEGAAFVPGDRALMVDIGGFRFGLSICYDLFFPELCRRYALMGADVLLCASASPMRSQTPFERVLPARAVENTCYVLFVNNVGDLDKFQYFGGSRAISPLGHEMESCGDSGHCLLEVELQRNELERAREGRPTLRDHRGDVDWGNAV